MDNEVEMIENGCHAVDDDDIVPAEEMEGAVKRSAAVQMRRQDRCFSVALVAFALSLLVFTITHVYMEPAELEIGHEADSGTIDKEGQKTKIDEKLDKINKGKDHFDIQEWKKNHGKWQPGHPGTNVTGAGHRNHFDNRKWRTSTVTIQDGKMFEVVGQLKHDPNAFLEGLAFHKNKIFESTGLKGKSTIRTLDPRTGEVIESIPLDNHIFGEGLTIVRGKAIQLSYTAKKGFIYDANDLSKPPETFDFTSTTGEGWGLTYDKHKDECIMSDGSDKLLFLDPNTMKQKRQIKVQRQNNKRSDNINELEFFHGRVLANVWHEDCILVINQETGEVEKEYDFSFLWPKVERKKKGAGVLNGISTAKDPSLLYVTGKNWDRMFIVRLLF